MKKLKSYMNDFEKESAGVLCKLAMKTAEKTVDVNHKAPICTCIIHQPDVPAGLRTKMNKEK